jgi:hypothetical protein
MQLSFLIQKSPDRRSFTSFPELIAGYHVFRRLSMPRHPPYTLSSLITFIDHRQRDFRPEISNLKLLDFKSEDPKSSISPAGGRGRNKRSILYLSPKRCSTTPARQKDHTRYYRGRRRVGSTAILTIAMNPFEPRHSLVKELLVVNNPTKFPSNTDEAVLPEIRQGKLIQIRQNSTDAIASFLGRVTDLRQRPELLQGTDYSGVMDKDCLFFKLAFPQMFRWSWPRFLLDFPSSKVGKYTDRFQLVKAWH